MAKSRNRGVDIHSQSMVKTVFVLSSLAILAFLVLIVKTTSFKSEPQAAPKRDLLLNCQQKFASTFKTNINMVNSKMANISGVAPFKNVHPAASCKGDYVSYGLVADTKGSLKCCVRKDIDSYWKNQKKKAGVSKKPVIPVNYSVTACGAQRVNCLNGYPNVSNVVCAAAQGTTAYKCAVNVGFATSCSNGGGSYMTTGGQYRVCFL